LPASYLPNAPGESTRMLIRVPSDKVRA
jgi:hypothetical protein